MAHLVAGGVDLACLPGGDAAHRWRSRVDGRRIELGHHPHLGPVGVGAVDVGHALLVIPRHQGRVGGLEAHQLAFERVTTGSVRVVFPVAVPVGVEHVGGAVEVEAAIGGLLPAGVLLVGQHGDPVVGRQPLPIADTVDRLPLVPVLLAALDAAVDDVDGGAKAIADARRDLPLGGHPGAVDHVQHGGLGSLGRQEEPDGGGKVEPGVGHQPRVVEEHCGIAAKHGLREGTVVEVVGELLGAATEIALAGAARPLLVLPVVLAATRGVAGLSLRPAHLPHVHQGLLPLLQPQRIVGDIVLADVAAGLLGEVGEGGDDGLLADGVGVAPVRVVAAEGGELADRPQEALVGVFRGGHLGQEVPVRFGEDPLDPLDVVRVAGGARHDRLHHAIGPGREGFGPDPVHGVGGLGLRRAGKIRRRNHIAAAVLGIGLDRHGGLARECPDEGDQTGSALECEHG